MNEKLEVLAPAGNYECFLSAIANGANAVYLGLDKFSARAKAENFTIENLKQMVVYAHLSNVRIYLTVNTLMKDDELSDALMSIKEAWEIGIDAIIVQDMGLLAKIRSIMPDIVIHLSTQAGIHNLEGALFAEKLGANRIILSREVLLEDIKKIKQNTNLEIECFVQGALCISFSGNCYFSSLVSGYSGNRGKCLQLCRKPYIINNKKEYYLSPKDLQLVDEIDKLIDAGVTSFKIEGRMRRKEYVAEAVRMYSKAIAHLDYSESKDNLLKLYNRGNYCKAHLFTPTNNVIYSKAQNHIGKKIGIVENIKGNKAFLSCHLNKGDGIKFFRNDIEVGHALVSNSGNLTTFLGDVNKGDCVNITTDSALMNKINSKSLKKVHCNLDIILNPDQKITINITNGNVITHYEDDYIVQRAKSMPLSRENIIESMQKTGDLFTLDKVNVLSVSDIFVPKSILNNARRNAFDKFKSDILFNYNLSKQNNFNSFNKISFTDKKYDGIIAQIDNLSNIDMDFYNSVDYIAYAPQDFASAYNQISSYYQNFDKEIIIVLPNIARGKDIDIIKKTLSHNKIKTVVANNLYAMTLCKDKNIIGGIFFNLINHEIMGEKIMSLEYSPKLNEDNFIYVFGKAPLMSFVHCVNKTINGSCNGCDGNFNINLTDERNNLFNVYHYKVGYCYSQLLNNIPVCAGKNIKNLNLTKMFVDLVGYQPSSWYNIINSIKTNNFVSLDKITNGYFGKILQ